jgi:hypothetical protein
LLSTSTRVESSADTPETFFTDCHVTRCGEYFGPDACERGCFGVGQG